MAVSLLMGGCAPISAPAASEESSVWKPADLRWLGESSADLPAQYALTAVYTRESAAELQIRLDFLDSLTPADSDLYIALDTQPGGETALPFQTGSPFAWDLTILDPAQGTPIVFLPGMKTSDRILPTIERDPLLDTAVIHLPREKLPGNLHPFHLCVWVTAPGETAPLSSAGPLLSTDAELSSAPVLLAFWNTLPAATPAQALRRWDGAHTGPLGQRHGLKQIITASSQTRLPVVLLDLKTPEALSGLDALGAIPEIQQALAQGLLILPDVIWGDPQAAQESRALSRWAAQRFELPASMLVFGAGSPYPTATAAFAELTDVTHLGAIKTQRLIPLPGSVYTSGSAALSEDVSPQGPGISLRRALLHTALTPDPSDLLVLGGSLPDSLWGDSSIAPVMFNYLAAHPWIKVLNEAALLSMPVLSGNTYRCDTRLCLPGVQNSSAGTLTDLRAAPQNALTDSAWMLYLTLTQPSADPNRVNLRKVYLGETETLLAAARWEEASATGVDCSRDLDSDGAAECLLGNAQVFAVLESDGARMSFMFSRTGSGAIQWVGPASQFSVGLSDPSQWDVSAGVAADPNEIPGVSSPDWNRLVFTTQPTDNGVTFTSPDGTVQVSYTLEGAGIRLDASAPQGIRLRVPLAIDPSMRFSPQWAARYWAGTDSWGFSDLARVKIASSGAVTLTHFDESQVFLRTMEDPDRSYPSGHYLPFPMAVAEVTASSPVWISLQPVLPPSAADR